MGRNILGLLIIALLQLGTISLAQSNFAVSEPSFELKDNSVLIYFDILNSSPSEIFDIRIDITDSEGNRIKATALEGDIGEMIQGGNNKLIIWDLSADGIVMNDEIIVNIYAKLIQPETSSPDSFENANQMKTAGYNRTGLILQSIALPGLGLSRMTGKPHWIRGLAGYGCVTGAIALNKAARSAYEDFLEAETTAASDSYMKSATRQDNVSEALAYVAIGIWVTDIIWTVLGTGDSNKKQLYGETKGFRFATSYDPMTSSPLVGINFRF